MKTIFSITLTAVLFSGMFLAAGCNKKKDTIAKIYVRDKSNGALVQGCTVVLKGVSTEGRDADVNLNVTTETNAAGEAIFNFNEVYKKGQAGVAVLNIEAKKNALTGSGIIKVEEEVTNEETVYI